MDQGPQNASPRFPGDIDVGAVLQDLMAADRGAELGVSLPAIDPNQSPPPEHTEGASDDAATGDSQTPEDPVDDGTLADVPQAPEMDTPAGGVDDRPGLEDAEVEPPRLEYPEDGDTPSATQNDSPFEEETPPPLGSLEDLPPAVDRQPQGEGPVDDFGTDRNPPAVDNPDLLEDYSRDSEFPNSPDEEQPDDFLEVNVEHGDPETWQLPEDQRRVTNEMLMDDFQLDSNTVLGGQAPLNDRGGGAY